MQRANKNIQGGRRDEEGLEEFIEIGRRVTPPKCARRNANAAGRQIQDRAKPADPNLDAPAERNFMKRTYPGQARSSSPHGLAMHDIPSINVQAKRSLGDFAGRTARANTRHAMVRVTRLPAMSSPATWVEEKISGANAAQYRPETHPIHRDENIREAMRKTPKICIRERHRKGSQTARGEGER